jgi:MFS family permease
MIVVALGVTWILDGIEVTLGGAVSGVLQDPRSLGLSAAEIGFIGSAYVAGAVLGALIFGYLTDRWGRKKLFLLTLVVYLSGVLLSALSWNAWSFAIFRLITGAGIGGEYAAINSAVDELIPARVRGHVDLIINGTYWVGAALGSLSTLLILNPALFAVDHGWRFGFALGGLIGLVILFLRGHVPESPRWLMVHGRRDEAEEIVAAIETRVARESASTLAPVEATVPVHPRRSLGFLTVARLMWSRYRSRAALGLVLMISQAFLYNAIFFTYALVLTTFYAVPAPDTGIYLLPFAIGNFLGPLLLGRFFDTLGRRLMISSTYAVSAILLVITGYLFNAGVLSAASQTLLWSVIFFFASAAASAAYLTISEIFPLEMRGLAIAFFFAIGTGAGGIAAPWLFGVLIGSGSRPAIFSGYAFAAVLMLAASAVEWLYGVDAEGKALEHIAPPLSYRPEDG